MFSLLSPTENTTYIPSLENTNPVKTHERVSRTHKIQSILIGKYR
ncbi:MAG: hypothetical protein MjAS7_2179 [Metallosphaera javensis (ex Sakai et al. 2022)]|nr:MAG: hypothetical protein MjAS7_2179 [Metallosphaera javensis (ex Sakai et al. 2022)]